MAPKLPIYLDHNATTPVDPRVLEAMLPYFTTHFGNAASRTHAFGWKAEAAVKEARETIADALSAQPKEIVFTSGATESNNLAILGAARAYRERGEARDHVVTSTIEHNAVLDPFRQLEREGFRVTFVPPDRYGVTSADAIAAAVTEKTLLVSLMAANNEIGTLNPIGGVARLCKDRGILFHTDAAQAFGKVPLSVHDLGVDLLSLSAHKIYGPKGVGALFVRASNPRVTLAPLVHGGGHEKGLRSGTLDVPAIAGFSTATRLALSERERDEARIRALRDRLWEGIRAKVPNALLNGHATERLAGNLNVAFEGAESDALLLEMKELAVSTGSACTSASLEPSHVLSGIGLSEALSKSSIRFGLGRYTTREEIDLAIEVVSRAVAAVRARSPRALLGQDVPALP